MLGLFVRTRVRVRARVRAWERACARARASERARMSARVCVRKVSTPAPQQNTHSPQTLANGNTLPSMYLTSISMAKLTGLHEYGLAWKLPTKEQHSEQEGAHETRDWSIVDKSTPKVCPVIESGHRRREPSRDDDWPPRKFTPCPARRRSGSGRRRRATDRSLLGPFSQHSSP